MNKAGASAILDPGRPRWVAERGQAIPRDGQALPS
jgi:hypothetical protein